MVWNVGSTSLSQHFKFQRESWELWDELILIEVLNVFILFLSINTITITTIIVAATTLAITENQFLINQAIYPLHSTYARVHASPELLFFFSRKTKSERKFPISNDI